MVDLGIPGADGEAGHPRCSVWRLGVAPGQPSSWGPGLNALLGRDPHDPPPVPDACAALVHDPVWAEFASALGEAASGRGAGFHVRVPAPDGTLRRLVGWVEPETGRGGAVVAVLGCLHDETQRAAAGESLRESEDRLRRSVEGIDAIVVYRESDDDPLWFSAQIERILGHDPDALDRFEDWNALVHPEDLPGCRAVWDAQPASWSLEYRVRRGDGSWTWVSDRGRRIPASGGRPPGVFSVITDIAERRELEERLRGLERIEAVADLAGGLAHHYNNLLAAILGHVELARAVLPPGEPRDDLEAALEATARAAALTRKMLAFGRRELLERGSTDVAEAMRALHASLVPILRPEVEVAVSAGDHPLSVPVPRRLLEQVVTSLALYTADLIPAAGRLSIAVRPVHRETTGLPDGVRLPAGDYARLTVSGTDPGLDAASVARLFEPFFSANGPGTGLGMELPAVHGIVRQAGGTIDVASAPGRGTVFTIDLPVATTVHRLEQAPTV